MRILKNFMLVIASMFVMSISALIFAPGVATPADKTATIVAYDAIEGTHAEPWGYCEITLEVEGQNITSREELDACTKVGVGQKIKVPA